MKYYTLKLKIHNDTLDKDSPGFKVYPCANGENVINAKGFFWNGKIEGKIFFEKIANNTPIFDYYYLYNSTYQKEYDWILLDAYRFIGPNSLSGRGFMVSEKFKQVIEKFKIAEPFRFYEARLMYQGEKLKYFIFHLAQNEWKEFQSDKSSFFIGNEIFNIEDDRAFRKFIKNAKNQESIWGGTIVLNTFSDFFYFAHIGYVISETLKKSIEENNLTDFEIEQIENLQFEFFKSTP